MSLRRGERCQVVTHFVELKNELRLSSMRSICTDGGRRIIEYRKWDHAIATAPSGQPKIISSRVRVHGRVVNFTQTAFSAPLQIDDEPLQAALDNGSLLVVNSGSDLPVSHVRFKSPALKKLISDVQCSLMSKAVRKEGASQPASSEHSKASNAVLLRAL